MNRLRKVIFSALLILSATACEKEPQQSKEAPVDITGTWVFSQLYTGTAWTNQNIKELYVFDGEGNYYIKTYTGTDRVTFSNGVVGSLESEFERKPGDVNCTCTYTGDQYTFSSIGTTPLKLNERSDFCLEFSSRKLEKVTAFEKKDPGPEDDDPDRPGYINNTFIQDGNDIVGCIRDASTGKGIPGVPVSDGYSLVKTDANGVYQFAATNKTSSPKKITRYVFYTVPAEYQVETENGIPNFYKNITYVPNKGWHRNDWTLTPRPDPLKNWTFVGIGDPQCGSTTEIIRYTKETIADMKDYLSRFPNPYGVVLGDITHDSNGTWPGMKSSMENVSIDGRVMPFYQVMGNHDHNARVDNAYECSQLYIDNFGPENYSFNIGDVHVVCFDNVIVKNRETNSGKANGWTWHEYDSGMTDDCFEWFKKDMACVENKAEKMLLICVHIPYLEAAPKHRTEMMTYVKQFKEAHIMAGHTHFNRNYVHSNYVTKSGMPVYEHVHGAACGAWWEAGSSINQTGAPAGYTVYEIEGPSIVNWVMKGSQKAPEHQFRVYDGNQTYTGTKGYNFNWYKTDNKGGSAGIVCKGYEAFLNSFVVEVFDDCPKYVNVALYQNGLKVGDFIHAGRSMSANICLCSYLFNERNKNTTTWSNTNLQLWYLPVSGTTPSQMKDWEVRVTRRIPSNGKENIYTCSTLTTGYDDFKRTIF